MVLAVKMLSFIRNHVSIANIILPTPKTISLEVHSDPEASTVFFIACQNNKPTGIENIKLEVRGRVDHQDQTNCELSWNHANMLATTKNNIPAATSMLTYANGKAVQLVDSHESGYHEIL